jgi:hypothetical protein
MTKSVAYVLMIISVLIVAVVMASRYFGVSVPVIGPIITNKALEFTLLAYWMLFITASRPRS